MKDAKVHAYKAFEKGRDFDVGFGFQYYHLVGLCGTRSAHILLRTERIPEIVRDNTVLGFTLDPSQVSCLRCLGAKRYGLWLLAQIEL